MSLLEDKKLVDVFNDVWEMHHQIINNTEGSASDKIQQIVNDALGLLRLLSDSVEQLGLFSRNEDLEEMVTSDLRYFLLPAITADVTSHKKCDIQQRLALLTDCRKHFTKFLKSCQSYGFEPLDAIERALGPPTTNPESRVIVGGSSKPDVQAMSAARDAKIKNYQLERSRVKKLKDLEARLEDEGACREYWMLQIQQWITTALKEMSSMQGELSMLEQMRNVPRADFERERQEARKGSGVKPFMLTKDKMQAAVFGAGYPSVPTVTLEEFFEREAAACLTQQAAKVPQQDLNGEKDSSDDETEDKLMKQRAMDDWKDDHRRGAGNRKNMG